MTKIKYQPVIGLEIHVELNTKAKMFCHCLASHFQAKPNQNVCPVCLGLPGAMPYPNKLALYKTLVIARLLNCQINPASSFERKHYFYPDLPKGYQLTQYIKPLGYNGYLQIEDIKYPIRRVHQEEDTAKLKHQIVNGQKLSLVDFNRSGVPLVEIVTEPAFSSARQAVVFLKTLQKLLRFHQVSDCDMEKGSMRLEANVSVKKASDAKLPDYKVELKNINSFKFTAEAIDYEIKRQIKLLEKSKAIPQQTRGYDPKLKRTFPQRQKEEAHDYKYLLEPDIPPIHLPKSWLEETKNLTPANQLLQEWINKGWPESVVKILFTHFDHLSWWRKLEEQIIKKQIDRKKLGHFLLKNKSRYYLKPASQLVQDFLAGQHVVDDSKLLTQTIDQIIKDNPQAVEDFLAGKQQALYFLLGRLRYKIGNVDAPKVIKMIKDRLTKLKTSSNSLT
ncbi:MAG: Asp-tRNA(Asn)/Glu-tRNA(Gln) amidotransferase subunit GatB [bacterium]|nr:Asp-tRNA(Asn)/Glu-tRNA(Gln) amidotransferase subunit GatB [bacterium]